MKLISSIAPDFRVRSSQATQLSQLLYLTKPPTLTQNCQSINNLKTQAPYFINSPHAEGLQSGDFAIPQGHFLRATTVGDRGRWVSPAGLVGAAASQRCPLAPPQPHVPPAVFVKACETFIIAYWFNCSEKSGKTLINNLIIGFVLWFTVHQI